MSDLFSTLLAEFGKASGISGLAPEEDGYCCLSFDDLFVNLEYNQESRQLFLSANLAELPATGREQLYETLLEANYFFRGTAGGTLCMDKPSRRIALVFQTPLSILDAGFFTTVIENFVNAAELWQKKISTLISETGNRGSSFSGSGEGGLGVNDVFGMRV